MPLAPTPFEEALAKAGVRLSAWLYLIVAGKTKFSQFYETVGGWLASVAVF